MTDPPAQRSFLPIGADTRRATLLRLALSSLFGFSSLLLAVGVLGTGNPVGLALLPMPAYLLWAWIADGIALARSGTGSVRYSKRPAYWIWLSIAAALTLSWLVWASIHGNWP